jgi:hypothetical protein
MDLTREACRNPATRDHALLGPNSHPITVSRDLCKRGTDLGEFAREASSSLHCFTRTDIVLRALAHPGFLSALPQTRDSHKESPGLELHISE